MSHPESGPELLPASPEEINSLRARIMHCPVVSNVRAGNVAVTVTAPHDLQSRRLDIRSERLAQVTVVEVDAQRAFKIWIDRPNNGPYYLCDTARPGEVPNNLTDVHLARLKGILEAFDAQIRLADLYSASRAPHA